MRENIVQGVAAFMNCSEGGALIIGVSNHGNIVGIAEDMAAADHGKRNEDGYQLFLHSVIGNAIGTSHTASYKSPFIRLRAKRSVASR